MPLFITRAFQSRNNLALRVPVLELHDIRITEVNSGDNMLPRKITQGCLAALLMATAFTASAEEITLDAAAAIVNNDIILESELDAAQQSVAEQFRARGSAVNDVSARKAALENLITRSLVLQLARNQGLELNDMQLDQAIAQAATRNGDTPQEFLERLARENGLTVNEARDRFRDEMILSEVRQARVRNRVSVSESEVELLAKSLRNVGSVEPRYHLAQLIVPLDCENHPHDRSEYIFITHNYHRERLLTLCVSMPTTVETLRAELEVEPSTNGIVERHPREEDGLLDVADIPQEVVAPVVVRVLEARPHELCPCLL